MFEDAVVRTETGPYTQNETSHQVLTPNVGSQAINNITLVVAGRLFRDCLEHVLRKVARFHIHACETLAEVGQANASIPDLMICHIEQAENTGVIFDHLRRLKNAKPSIKFLILRREASLEFVHESVGSGVHGILLEDSPEDVLRLAVEMVLLGYSFVPADLTHLLLAERTLSASVPTKFAQTGWINPRLNDDKAAVPEPRSVEPLPSTLRHSHLSGRETQILRCLEQGQSNKVIARELEIAEATVKVHVQALLRKMRVTNRTQAAIAARNFLVSSAVPDRGDILARALDIATVASPQASHDRSARPPNSGRLQVGGAP